MPQYDSAFYRTHDPIGNVQSQPYAANLPVFTSGPFVPPHLAAGKRGTYSAYASSIASQQELSTTADTASIVTGSRGPPSIAFTQSDRLNDGFYKGDDDFDADTRSQAGFTEY